MPRPLGTRARRAVLVGGKLEALAAVCHIHLDAVVGVTVASTPPAQVVDGVAQEASPTQASYQRFHPPEKGMPRMSSPTVAGSASAQRPPET